MSVEGANMQLPRQRPEPQHNISCPSVASQVVGKRPKFSTFSGDSTQKWEVLLEQWAFEVKTVMQSHTEVTLREGIVWSLCRATAGPGLISRSASPSVRDNKYIRTCIWHHGILWYF